MQMTEIIHHIVATWGYYAVFAFCALEGFGFFFIPGETSLIAASIAAAGVVSRNGEHLDIVWVLVLAFCGAVLGDNVSYLVGDLFGFRLLNRYGHYVRLNVARLKFVQYLYLRYGSPIVFIGRFVMLLRAWESFLAGANSMSWRKFFPINAAAIVVWVCIYGLGAYGLGQASEQVLAYAGLGIFAAFCVAFAWGWIYFRRHEEALEAVAEKALPGPLRARPQGSKGEKAAKETPLSGKQ